MLFRSAALIATSLSRCLASRPCSRLLHAMGLVLNIQSSATHPIPNTQFGTIAPNVATGTTRRSASRVKALVDWSGGPARRNGIQCHVNHSSHQRTFPAQISLLRLGPKHSLSRNMLTSPFLDVTHAMSISGTPHIRCTSTLVQRDLFTIQLATVVPQALRLFQVNHGLLAMEISTTPSTYADTASFVSASRQKTRSPRTQSQGPCLTTSCGAPNS